MVHIWSIYGPYISMKSPIKIVSRALHALILHKKVGVSSPTFFQWCKAPTSPERPRVDLRCQALCGSEVSDSLRPAPVMILGLGWSSVEKTWNKRLVCCLMKCSKSSVSAYYIPMFYPMFGKPMTKRSGIVASVSAIGQLSGAYSIGSQLQVTGSSMVDLRFLQWETTS